MEDENPVPADVGILDQQEKCRLTDVAKRADTNENPIQGPPELGKVDWTWRTLDLFNEPPGPSHCDENDRNTGYQNNDQIRSQTKTLRRGYYGEKSEGDREHQDCVGNPKEGHKHELVPPPPLAAFRRHARSYEQEHEESYPASLLSWGNEDCPKGADKYVNTKTNRDVCRTPPVASHSELYPPSRHNFACGTFRPSGNAHSSEIVSACSVESLTPAT